MARLGFLFIYFFSQRVKVADRDLFRSSRFLFCFVPRSSAGGGERGGVGGWGLTRVRKIVKQCSLKQPHGDNICSGWLILNTGPYNFETI